MAIKIVIAFSNNLFSEGGRGLLSGSEDLQCAGVLSVGAEARVMIDELKPDIILVDLMTLYNGFVETGPHDSTNFILFDSGCGNDNISAAVSAKGIEGVISGDTNADEMKKAIRTVARGGKWLEQAGVTLSEPVCSPYGGNATLARPIIPATSQRH